MIWFILFALLVAAEGRATPETCVMSDWGPWTPWMPENHDNTGRSFPVEGKTGVGRERMSWIRQEVQEHYDEVRRCKLDPACLLYDERPSEGPVSCIGNMANDLECRLVDQLSYVSIADMLFDPNIDISPSGSDLWAWTDGVEEYAIMGLTIGTTFIKVTDPLSPVVLVHIRTQNTADGAGGSIWRDMKVIGDYVFIVSEEGHHGMQVFDMRRLRDVTEPVWFIPDAMYEGFGNCHNIVADEETNFVYGVGCTWGEYTNLCDGGLHVVDVSDPLNPTYAGCFGGDGYVHDAQCLIYHGPDVTYQDREICFCYNEEHFTIVDVNDKSDMTLISRTGYSGAMYTHQGWITEDHTLVLLDDELDEIDTPDKVQKTYIWDVEDLDAPLLVNTYRAPFESLDHNQYIHQGLTYQSNYQAGLRILSIDQENFVLTEVAYFDNFPNSTVADWGGSWSVYPYFNSRNVIVTSSPYGMWTVRPDYDAIENVIREKKNFVERKRYREILEGSDAGECPALFETEKMQKL